MTSRSVMVFLATAFVASNACADIGTVGAQVTPSNAPAPAAAAPEAKAATPAPAAAPTAQTLPSTTPPQKPLLVIRFNQQHVHFEQTLRQAINSAEHAKTGVVYSVVSYVPIGNTPVLNRRNADTAEANLKAVLAEMVNDGVNASRIGTNSLSSPTGGTQEIHIYVQ